MLRSTCPPIVRRLGAPASVLYIGNSFFLCRSSVGLKYTPGPDEAVARHLQTVAWDTLQDNLKP